MSSQPTAGETPQQRYARLHPEAVREAQRRYREKNRVQRNKRRNEARLVDPTIRERERAYEITRSEEIRARKAAEYEANREAKLKRNRRWRERSKAEISEYNRRYYESHKTEHKARVAVAKAIKSGTLVPPAACERCGEATTKLIGHHHSYAPEHWLDVEWLCKKCHVRHHASEGSE